MGTSAEDTLTALARDLLEEISAGRALELAADPQAREDLLALAGRYNIRGYQRTENVGGREVQETVRPHSAERLGGGPGMQHPGDLRKIAGAPATMAHGYISPEKWLEGQKEWAAKGKAIWAANRWHDVHKESAQLVSQHLADAQQHLAPKSGHPDFAKGYQALHEAHRVGVEHVLPRAQTDEQRAGVTEGLQHIQQRMEDINEATGTDKGVTRKLTGGIPERVKHAASQIAEPTHPQVQPQLPPPQLPPPPTGAGAVHPQLGGHLPRVPGETISQRAYSHVPRPMPAAGAPSPEASALAQANSRLTQYAEREQQRRVSDLRQHVSDIRAAELKSRGIAPPGTYAPLSDEQFAHHVAQLEEQVSDALSRGLATDQQYALDPAGTIWDPERSLAHRDIIKNYMDAQVDVPTRKQAIMLGGPPGAGKSTMLENHRELDPKDYAVINTDHFKEVLAQRGMVPEVAGLSPMESSALVHEESAYLADLAAAELQRRGKNLIFDGTMRNLKVTRERIAELKKHGYSVGSIFVDAPVGQSARGVERRYRQGLEEYRAGRNPLGGRHVPRSVVLSGEAAPGRTQARDTFERLKPDFSFWERHDASSGRPRLAEKSGSVRDTQRASSGGIPSAEELRRQAGKGIYGTTEDEARSRETGGAGS